MSRLAIVLLVVLALAPRAAAQSAEPFGRAGQWLLDGSVGFRLSRHEGGAVDMTRNATWISPGILWFVANDFALGAALQVERSTQDSVGFNGVRLAEDSVGAALRIAHNHAISEHVSVFPQYALGYASVSRSIDLTASLGPPDDRFAFVPLRAVSEGSSDAWTLSAHVPLLWHPARHVFLGAGPTLAFAYYTSDSLQNRALSFSLGLSTTIGAWID